MDDPSPRVQCQPIDHMRVMRTGHASPRHALLRHTPMEERLSPMICNCFQVLHTTFQRSFDKPCFTYKLYKQARFVTVANMFLSF